MTKDTLAKLMRTVFDDEIMALREAGQREYAHDEGNAFANFDRAAADLNLDRKMILWIFAMKHRDGIASYLKGHQSQREDVRGRINDLIVYLLILRGMIEEEKGVVQSHDVSTSTPTGPVARASDRAQRGAESG
jgi:hypothetical protein